MASFQLWFKVESLHVVLPIFYVKWVYKLRNRTIEKVQKDPLFNLTWKSNFIVLLRVLCSSLLAHPKVTLEEC